jgi:hypothetical protein
VGLLKIEKATGERLRYEVHGNKILIIWPDGEVTNEIDVSLIE